MVRQGLCLTVTLLCCVSLVACAAEVRTYDNAFTADDTQKPNVRTFAAPASILYSAISKVILADNFQIEKDDGKALIAGKYFTEGDKTITLAISIEVKDAGNAKSIVYASAVQSISRIRVKNEYFNLLFIPTPIKTSSQATQTQEEKKTINDKNFYDRLFSLVQKQISTSGEQDNPLNVAAPVNQK